MVHKPKAWKDWAYWQRVLACLAAATVLVTFTTKACSALETKVGSAAAHAMIYAVLDRGVIQSLEEEIRKWEYELRKTGVSESDKEWINRQIDKILTKITCIQAGNQNC